MDTSKEYIKMCQKAEEIQDNWILTDGDYIFYPDNLVRIWLSSDDSTYPSMTADVIWLPRQDQLYELHTPYDSKEYSAYGIGRLFGIWLFHNKNYTHKQIFNSIEQHLLAFVMHDVFRKIWNGNSWIKHNINYEKATLFHKTPESKTGDNV